MAVPVLGVLLVPVLLVAVVGAVLWAVLRRPEVTVRAGGHSTMLAVQRHTLIWRLVGVVVGFGVPLLVVSALRPGPRSPLGLGRDLAVAPAVGAVLFLLAVVAGELTAPRARARVRTATLRTRRVVDVLPPLLTATVGTGVVLLAAALAIGGLAGRPDDLGRAGRTLTATCTVAGAGLVQSSVGPWPGAFYVVPMGSGLLLAIVTAVAGLVVITRRPRPSAEDEELDTAMRRQSARNVLLGVGVVAFATLAPVLLAMAAALHGNDCGPAWWDAAAAMMLPLAVACVLLAVWSLSSLLVTPGVRIRQVGEQPSSPVGSA
ncbi:MAG TPA: hypothetical protein VFX33_13400 [Actinomycetales bacterium]|nr:hypothetical protein [Actinomycetales bacterium]